MDPNALANAGVRLDPEAIKFGLISTLKTGNVVRTKRLNPQAPQG
jgi:hypothetical protein